MARKKPIISNSVDKKDELIAENESPHDSVSTDSTSESISSVNNEFLADEYYNEGQLAYDKQAYDLAADLFEAAVKAKTKQLQSDDNLHSDLAKYWFGYGKALLKDLESKQDFLHLRNIEQTSDDEDDLEYLIWATLDTARLCYTKKLNNFEEIDGFRKVNHTDDFNAWITSNYSNPYWTTKNEDKLSTEFKVVLLEYLDVRLLLGDFCLSMHSYDQAVVEFSDACLIIINYGLSSQELLAALVPLAYLYITLDKGPIKEIYQCCINICKQLSDDKKTNSTNSLDTINTLLNDLTIQLSEFINSKQKEASNEDQTDAKAEAKIDNDNENNSSEVVQIIDADKMGLIHKTKKIRFDLPDEDNETDETK